MINDIVSSFNYLETSDDARKHCRASEVCRYGGALHEHLQFNSTGNDLDKIVSCILIKMGPNL